MYISTRGNIEGVMASKAIALGMVPNGGLFVPNEIPKISKEQIEKMTNWSYQEVACEILGLYLDDFSSEEIKEAVYGAYNVESFDHPDIAPVVKLDEQNYILELWHGPTAAFKDMALQLTPRLIRKSLDKIGSEKELVILVATSGDTGKAALEGFKNLDKTKIIVFYPINGVSEVQRLQMATTDGENTYVVAVKGNFDDCQNAVKEIFADQEFKGLIGNHGYQFSSANSINWGRLLPQIVYYYTAYLNLVRDFSLPIGNEVNFVVPTGNFGNILAAWYAKQMGLPIGKLICASNENKVLTDFFTSGTYNKNREFRLTNSPSMDILISSNLERFLFEMTNHDNQKVNEWMDELNRKGLYTVSEELKMRVDEILVAGFATEEETLNAINRCYKENHYVLDTHTAIALKVAKEYQKETDDQNPTVIDATASPYKFANSVYEAIAGKQDKEELELIEEISRLANMPIHKGLEGLGRKKILHDRVADKEEIRQEIKSILNLK